MITDKAIIQALNRMNAKVTGIRHGMKVDDPKDYPAIEFIKWVEKHYQQAYIQNDPILGIVILSVVADNDMTYARKQFIQAKGEFIKLNRNKRLSILGI